MPANNAIVGQTAPASRMPLSVFKGSVPGFASMNYGRIYPVFMKYQEAHSKLILNPGTLIRGATPISPTMGNAMMELTAFSVPWRIIWNYTKQFFGENDTSAWTQSTVYTKPQVKVRVGHLMIGPSDSTVALNATAGSVNTTLSAAYLNNSRFDYVKVGELPGSVSLNTKYGLDASIDYALYVDCGSSDCYGANKVLDYLGIHPIPKNADPYTLQAFIDTQIAKGSDLVISLDALPLRAFFSIVNYYFRDQNYQAPYLFTKDNSDLELGVGDHNEVGKLVMPYDFMSYRKIGVYTHETSQSHFGYEGSAFCPPASRLADPFSTFVPEPLKGDSYDLLSIAGLAPVIPKGLSLHHGASTDRFVFGDGNDHGYAGHIITETGGLGAISGTPGTGAHVLASSNLYADLSKASAITLDKFRDFVLLNQWNEKAVKGTRYAEILNEFYGVPINPALLDEPRFLGGVKIPISSWQVSQTAPNSDGSGVGDLGAFTHTKDQSELFTFNFDEPSICIVCAVARVEHTFAQQCDPHWFRKDKFDEHYSLFDGLGYQPLDKRIPYLPFGVVIDNNGTFPNSTSSTLGFQEYAWEERFQLGNAAGVLNASNPYSLDYFLYNELPTENPVGGPEYLSAYRDAEIVDRTLQLGENASLYAQQLLVNFAWNYTEAKMISKSGRNPGLNRI